jgi:hypothetical protein
MQYAFRNAIWISTQLIQFPLISNDTPLYGVMVLREESVRDQVTARGVRPLSGLGLAGGARVGRSLPVAKYTRCYHEGKHLPT